jgi:hypothetical protein
MISFYNSREAAGLAPTPSKTTNARTTPVTGLLSATPRRTPLYVNLRTNRNNRSISNRRHGD